MLALKAAGQDLNVIGIIAIILLIGIVKKNGIIIVDVALRLEREGKMSAIDAVREASHQRLRPILMTTACAALGGVPMILFSGTGSEFRRPLGFAIVGGLIVSQALTLFTTPVVYNLSGSAAWKVRQGERTIARRRRMRRTRGIRSRRHRKRCVTPSRSLNAANELPPRER